MAYRRYACFQLFLFVCIHCKQNFTGRANGLFLFVSTSESGKSDVSCVHRHVKFTLSFQVVFFFQCSVVSLFDLFRYLNLGSFPFIWLFCSNYNVYWSNYVFISTVFIQVYFYYSLFEIDNVCQFSIFLVPFSIAVFQVYKLWWFFFS